jgi:hypothetical protein
LGFGIGTEGRSFELLIELVDLVQRLLVGIGAIVVLLLRGFLRVVDFFLGVFRLVVLLKGAIHVDGANLHALGKGATREREGRENGGEDKLFHKCRVRQVGGMSFDCKCHLSFKIDSQR